MAAKRKERKLARKRQKAAARNKRQAEYRNRPHVCGGCRACCWQFPLGSKPARQWCKHVTPTGCGCHDDTRPTVCSEYQCGWLLSRWSSIWRPDRCGVIVTFHSRFRGRQCVVLSELWPGAVKAAKRVFEHLKGVGFIIVTRTPTDELAFYHKHTDLDLDASGLDELANHFYDEADKHYSVNTAIEFEF